MTGSVVETGSGGRGGDLLYHCDQPFGLLEMEQLLHLARRAPGLSKYEKSLQKLSIFFTKAFQFYRENAPGELSSLVSLWERYSAAVLQRFTGIMGVELRAADFVVANIFARFLYRRNRAKGRW